MISLSQLGLFLVIFFVMVAIVELIPDLVALYRDRYRQNMLRTTRELDKFFLRVKPARILLVALALGGVIGLAAGNWPAAVVVAVGGFFAPRIILSIWKEIRSSQVDAQLMDALLLMGNTLKSGLDIAAGVERVASTMKPPIAEEFGLVLNAYRLGTPLEQALLEMTHRIRSRTLETAIYAIGLQRETGGNLIKTFDQLVLTIREESKLQRKVRALTSQGRTQVVFLAGFPWFLGVLFYYLSPDTFAPALASPWGQTVVVGLLVWEAIGIVVTKRIVTIDL